MARALAADPDVLIFDEPTTGMDLPSQADILTFIKKLHLEKKMTIIMISHQLSHVISVTDHICLINKDRDIFFASEAEELLNEEKLSHLYGRKMKVVRSNGNVEVFAGEV